MKKIEERIQDIKAKGIECGVKIHLDSKNVIDENHLDCLWYGGDVGSIDFKGYKIVIGAYGDVRFSGKVNGLDVSVKDKANQGRAYQDLAIDYGVDDEQLYRLIDHPTKDSFLVMEDNNWFEFYLIAPNGEFIDLCCCDNVLENNLLENFEDVEGYFEYVDWAIANTQITQLVTKKDIDTLNKLDNLCGDGSLSDEEYYKFTEPDKMSKIENEVWKLMNDEHSKFSRASYYDGLAKEYEPDAINGHDLWTANLYNCDELYHTAIQNYQKSQLV